MRKLAIPCCLLLGFSLAAQHRQVQAADPAPAPAPTRTANLHAEKFATAPAGVALDHLLRNRFRQTERRKWRIAYHPIKHLEHVSSWHVEGTHWWVRLHPSELFNLDKLDKSAVYEIDGTAVDQNYGTIGFYLYRYPEKVSTGEVGAGK